MSRFRATFASTFALSVCAHAKPGLIAIEGHPEAIGDFDGDGRADRARFQNIVVREAP
jgi:hypothetical protein